MSSNENKIKEFESILNKISRFVKINIQKFDYQKNGIDP